MAKLVGKSGAHAGESFELSNNSVVGRSFDAEIRLNDITVSRHHCKFTRTARGFIIEDLGSGNGTRVNGERIHSPRQLRQHDRIDISNHAFEFIETDSAIQQPSESPRELGVEEDDDASGSTIAARLDVSSDAVQERISRDPRALLAAHTRLKTVLSLTNTIQGELELSRVLEEIMNAVFKVFPQADRGFILLREEDRFVTSVARSRSGDSDARVTVSRHIRDEVVSKRMAVLVADAMSDNRFSQAESVINFKIRSVMCVPLVARNDLVGIIHVDTLDPTAAFTPEDLELMSGMANQAAVAVANAKMHAQLIERQLLERDMQLAQQVQLSFLPERTPEYEGMKFCASYRSAMSVGGDFYDFIEQPDGRLGIVIGDVSGKGVPAALFMARMTSDVRFMALTESEPARVVEALNERVLQSGNEEAFVTLLFMSIDVNNGSLKIANAGHPPPLLRKAGEGAVSWFDEAIGFPLGVVPGAEYEQAELQLEPQETLSSFTDGVTEAMNSQRDTYGEARMLKVIGQGPSEPEAVLQRVLDDVQRFVGETQQSDDLTFVCFGRTE